MMRGSLYLGHQCVLFFPDVYHFPDLAVHSVAFSVSYFGTIQVYDVVERDVVITYCYCY